MSSDFFAFSGQTRDRGGICANTPVHTQTAYVRNVLGFIGLTDVEFIHAEGLALGDMAKAQAHARAESALKAGVASLDLAKIEALR